MKANNARMKQSRLLSARRFTGIPLVLVIVLVAAFNSLAGSLAQTPFFIPRPASPIKARLNGITTQIMPVEFDLSNQISSGQLEIGNAEINLTMSAPTYKYIDQEIGRYPAIVRVLNAYGCLAGDLNRYNLSITDRRAFAATPNTLTRKLLTLGDFIAHRFFLPGLDELKGYIEILEEGVNTNANVTKINTNAILDLQTRYNTMQSNYSALFDGLTQTDKLLTQAQQNQALINKDVRDEIAQQRVQNTKQDQNLVSLSKGLGLLGNQTQAGFANVNNQLIRLQDNTQTEIQAAYNQATVDQQAATQYLIGVMNVQFGKLYNITQQNVLRSDAEFLKTNTLIQKSLDATAGLAQMTWLYIHKQQLRRILSNKFFALQANMPAGYSALVSNGGLAPVSGGLSGADLLTLYDSFYMNYAANVTGPGGYFNQITSAKVEMFTDSEQSLDTAQGLITEEYIYKQFGPANCSRAFIGLDGFGDPIPEDAAYRYSDNRCRFWIEVTIQTCAALDPNFKWRSAEVGKTAYETPSTIQASYCATGVIATASKLVFRSFDDYLKWYGDTQCTANLWHTGADEEFQATNTKIVPFDERVYVRQNLSACYGNVPQQSSFYPPSVMSYQMLWIREKVPSFMRDVYSTEMKKYGRLPNGIHYDYVPFVYTPVRYDEDDNVIFDGGADPLDCVLATWRVVSDDTVPLNAITPKTGDYLSGEITVVDFRYGASTVPDYIETTITQAEMTITVDAAPLLPGNELYFGNPWVDAEIYDVPSNLMSTANQKDAAIHTFGELLMPPGVTTTLTFEEYQQIKGPWWQSGGSDTALTIESFGITTGYTATGAPFCLTTGGAPINGTNGQFGEQISPDPVPNGWLCMVFRFFETEKVFRQGQFEFHARPYNWRATSTLTAYSGEVTTNVNSRCSVAYLNALGDERFFAPGKDGVELVFTNTAGVDNTMQYVIQSSNASQIPFCNTIGTVTVRTSPPAPLTVVGIPSGCTQFNVTISRLAIDISNGNAIVPIPCQTISGSTVLQTLQEYRGVSQPVVQLIETQTDAVSVGLANVASNIGVILTESLLFSLQIIGYDPNVLRPQFAPIVNQFVQNDTKLQRNAIDFQMSNVSIDIIQQIGAQIAEDVQNNIAAIANSSARFARIDAKIAENDLILAETVSQNTVNQMRADVIRNFTKVELIDLAILDALGVHINYADYGSLSDYINAVGDALSGAGSFIRNGITGAANVVADVVGAAADAAFGIAGGAAGFFGGLGDFFKSGFGIMNLVLPILAICILVPLLMCACNKFGCSRLMGLSGGEGSAGSGPAGSMIQPNYSAGPAGGVNGAGRGMYVPVSFTA